MSNTFGEYVRGLRVSKRLSLRDVCRIAEYDPSNWSKIERDALAPPSDDQTLEKWAKALELMPNTDEHREFLDRAHISKGLIPKDLLSEADAMEHIPAFFRTIRGQKLTQEERDRLIELLKKS